MHEIWTALVTPFTSQNEIDKDAYHKHLMSQVSVGITGVIPCGTTGESPTLTLDEKKFLIRTAIQTLKGTGVKVLAGTGTNDTAESVELTQWAEQEGANGVIVVTPYYNRPSQAGLEAHYTAIADALEKDGTEVMLYNVPGRTGVSFTAETVGRLARHPRIRSIKDASGSPQLTNEIIEVLSAQKLKMAVLSGDDVNFLPYLSVGATGLVSVASNLIPAEMVSWMKLFLDGKVSEAVRLHQYYYPLFRDLFIESSPVPVKYAMSLVGKCSPAVRLPLAPLTQASKEKLKSTLQKYKFDAAGKKTEGSV